MGSFRSADRLSELARDVRRLCVKLVEDERNERSCIAAEAFVTRQRRDQALISYFEESERSRQAECPVHGEALYAACPDCRISAGMPPLSNVIPLSKTLECSTRVGEMAKKLGVDPAKAFQIARAAIGSRR